MKTESIFCITDSNNLFYLLYYLTSKYIEYTVKNIIIFHGKKTVNIY